MSIYKFDCLSSLVKQEAKRSYKFILPWNSIYFVIVITRVLYVKIDFFWICLVSFTGCEAGS